MFKRSLFVAVWFFLFCCVGVCDEPEFRTKATAKLVKHDFADSYLANFDLGILPAGKSGLVELEVETNSSRILDFSPLLATKYRFRRAANNSFRVG